MTNHEELRLEQLQYPSDSMSLQVQQAAIHQKAKFENKMKKKKGKEAVNHDLLFYKKQKNIMKP